MTGGRTGGKGLRHFSMKVCEKVQSKGRTTYNEVADELVKDFSNPEMAGARLVRSESCSVLQCTIPCTTAVSKYVALKPSIWHAQYHLDMSVVGCADVSRYDLQDRLQTLRLTKRTFGAASMTP